MTKPFIIRDLRQIRVLAVRGREEVADAVGVIGPCSVPELARFLHRTRHALYPHVKALRDSGILIESTREANGTKPTKEYDLPGRPTFVEHDLSNPRSTELIMTIARTRLREAQRGFERACRARKASTKGTRRNLWVARWKGWLSPKELEEANRHLHRLIDLLQSEPGNRRERRQLHELTFALAPVVAD
jgi:biotin operon repressor